MEIIAVQAFATPVNLPEILVNIAIEVSNSPKTTANAVSDASSFLLSISESTRIDATNIAIAVAIFINVSAFILVWKASRQPRTLSRIPIALSLKVPAVLVMLLKPLINLVISTKIPPRVNEFKKSIIPLKSVLAIFSISPPANCPTIFTIAEPTVTIIFHKVSKNLKKLPFARASPIASKACIMPSRIFSATPLKEAILSRTLPKSAWKSSKPGDTNFSLTT